MSPASRRMNVWGAALAVLVMAHGAAWGAPTCAETDWACRLAQANDVLAASGGEDAAPDRLHALVARGTALAELGRETDAVVTFRRVRAASPTWTPEAAASAAVATAWERSAPRPQPEPKPAPEPRPGPEPEQRDTVALSLGAGVALLAGDAADRHGLGFQGMLAALIPVSEAWKLRVQLTLALFPFEDGLAVEPGLSRGLALIAGTVGVGTAVRLTQDIDMPLGLGLGATAYGLRSLGDAAGVAIDGEIGARYHVSRAFAVRLDLAPVLTLPVTGHAVAAHVAVVIRGEARF